MKSNRRFESLAPVLAQSHVPLPPKLFDFLLHWEPLPQVKRNPSVSQTQLQGPASAILDPANGAETMQLQAPSSPIYLLRDESTRRYTVTISNFNYQSHVPSPFNPCRTTFK